MHFQKLYIIVQRKLWNQLLRTKGHSPVIVSIKRNFRKITSNQVISKWRNPNAYFLTKILLQEETWKDWCKTVHEREKNLISAIISLYILWKTWIKTVYVLKFVFFEKATKFEEISILLLTNKLVFLCFPPNFEFSVSYSSSLSGAPWDPSENYLILKSSKVGFC